jgi:putative transposase
VIGVAHILLRFLTDLLRLIALSVRPRCSLEAENLFLRRQLALYKERGIKPRRIDATTRMSLVFLSKLFDWRDALTIVRPETLIRWHRAGWRLLWRWKCRPGRPPIPLELRQFIRRIARENPLWGEERIANELLLKLGVRVSPRTVRKYMPKRPAGCPRGDQRWSTFLRNHAKAILACDFFVTATVTFRLLYVFVVIHHGSRQLLHFNVTAHPTSAWTLQQLREAVGYEECYRYLIHDRDTIFAKSLDQSIARLGMTVLKSPFQSPKACDLRASDWHDSARVSGLDDSANRIALEIDSQRMASALQRRASAHSLGSRSSWSAGIGGITARQKKSWHRLDALLAMRARSVLGGLHHEYFLVGADA